MKKFATLFVSFLLVCSLANAGDKVKGRGRKCCHKHGGIKECNKVAKHNCKDGATSNCPKHNH